MSGVIKCRICGRPLRRQDSVNRGVGPTCAKHSPPEHLQNHPVTAVRNWVRTAYDSFLSAHILMRYGQYYDSLYLAHLSIEKMLKAKMLHDTGKFDYGHNLVQFINKLGLQELMPDWMIDFCADLNPFQTAGRYPTEKERILRDVDEEFLRAAINNTGKVLKWIGDQMKSSR